ncbi:Translin [Biscogniauxia marginata]|nr:Translin [Biscogniauxia marginata]
MTEVIVPKKREGAMAGVKRDHQGKEKPNWKVAKEAPRNAYTSMFESFRDELDEHHDRRMRIGKVSRDVTALSKKIIFSLQRVRKLSQPLPARIQSETDERLREIAGLLASVEPDVRGANRHRYPLICLEELVEAVAFAHYLRHQALATPAQAQAQGALPPGIPLTPADYVFGVFDLTGEMMRFATAVTALSGAVPTGGGGGGKGDGEGEAKDGDVAAAAAADGEVEGEGRSSKRTILADMQEVSSMLQICPTVGGRPGTYAKKLDIMIEQVRKVERLGYGVAVRGNERPKGWMPDLNEAGGGGGGGDREDVTME